MGTETLAPTTVVSSPFTFVVKLNNPQMGTETIFESVLYSFVSCNRVKLNNP